MKQLSIASVFVAAWMVLVSAAFGEEFKVQELNHGPNGFFMFDPELVHINSGDTVHFVAVDKGHEVHSVPSMIPAKGQPFSANLSQDLDVRFVEPGIYVFACRPHTPMGMVGVVVVGDPAKIDEINPSSLPAKAKSKIEALLARVRNGS